MASTTISKKKVAKAAAKAMREHGWCDEINAILKELEIEPHKEKVIFTIEVDDISRLVDDRNNEWNCYDDDDKLSALEDAISTSRAYYAAEVVKGSVKLISAEIKEEG